MLDITHEMIDKLCRDALLDIERIVKNDDEMKSVTVDRINKDHSFSNDLPISAKMENSFPE